MLKQSSPLRGCGTAPEPYPPPALADYETHPAGCLRALGATHLRASSRQRGFWGSPHSRAPADRAGFWGSPHSRAPAGARGLPGFSRFAVFAGKRARGRGFVLAQFRSEGLGSRARCMLACISAIDPKPSVRGLFEHRTKTPAPTGALTGEAPCP